MLEPVTYCDLLFFLSLTLSFYKSNNWLTASSEFAKWLQMEVLKNSHEIRFRQLSGIKSCVHCWNDSVGKKCVSPSSILNSPEWGHTTVCFDLEQPSLWKNSDHHNSPELRVHVGSLVAAVSSPLIKWKLVVISGEANCVISTTADRGLGPYLLRCCTASVALGLRPWLEWSTKGLDRLWCVPRPLGLNLMSVKTTNYNVKSHIRWR